jgi:hypothetical protein
MDKKVVTGRCEKIDLQMWSEFGAKKCRSRMLHKRSLERRYTFRINPEPVKFQPNRFFTSSRRDVTDTGSLREIALGCLGRGERFVCHVFLFL